MKLLMLALSLIFPLTNVKEADVDTLLQDYKVYDTTYSIGGTNQVGQQMISKYFDSNVKVFKENDLYYLSVTLLNNQALSDLKISVSDLKSGILEEINGKKTTYTITLSYDDLNSDISLSGNVSKMSMDVSFTIRPNLDSLKETEETVSPEKEFPARFVPELTIDGVGDVETSLNSYYKIPEAKATFDNHDLDVNVSVTSPSGESVEVEDSKIAVTELGDYTIDFIASTDEYKTNLGNDSYAKESIKLTSNAITSSMVKVVDIHNILPQGYIVQCQRIESGTTYDKVSSLLATISENYEITNITMMDSTGQDIVLTDTVECYIETNPNYDRNKVKVYRVDDKLEEVSSSGYGRYVKFENKKMGTYVVLIEGVQSKTNLPLIISLTVIGVVILFALAVFLVIFFLRKRKQKVLN